MGQVLTFNIVIAYLLPEVFWSSEKKSLCILVFSGARNARYAQKKLNLLKLGKSVMVSAVTSMN